MNIDVYVELICPWCLIGKSNLTSALEQLVETDPDLRVQVQWHTVQLVPEVPREGWAFAEFYLRRLGSPEAVRQRQAQVRAAAAQAGAEIDFARIELFPDLFFELSRPAVYLEGQCTPHAHQAASSAKITAWQRMTRPHPRRSPKFS